MKVKESEIGQEVAQVKCGYYNGTRKVRNENMHMKISKNN